MKAGELPEGRTPITAHALGTAILWATAGQGETSSTTTLSLAFDLSHTKSRHSRAHFRAEDVKMSLLKRV